MRRAVALCPRPVLLRGHRAFQVSVRLLTKESGAPADDSPLPFPGPAKTRHTELARELGYFHEMLELSKTKGKPFVATEGLTAAADSPVFPFVAGDTLVSNGTLSLPACARGKVTLVALSFKQFGFVQLNSWVEPFLSLAAAAAAEGAAAGAAAADGSSAGHRRRSSSSGSVAVQVVQVSAMEGGFIANLLKGSIKAGLVAATPSELHATSIVAMGPIDPICSGLGVDNRLLGHVYLLDAEAQVRWRACGAATPAELGTLAAALKGLRLEK